jgi:hypothetical protein
MKVLCQSTACAEVKGEGWRSLMQEDRSELVLGAVYAVYGQCLAQDHLMYLVDPDKGHGQVLTWPAWYPAELFDVVDATVPSSWAFRNGHGQVREPAWVTAIWGYPELATSPEHFDGLLECEYDAMPVWVRRRLEIDAMAGEGDWPVRPFEGLGTMRFGAARQALRAQLGAAFESPYALNDIDAFPALGLRLYFDPGKRLEYIEAGRPCNAVFGGVALLDTELSETVRALAWLGHRAECDDTLCDFPELGFTLYAPWDESGARCPVSSVGIYKMPAAG